MKNDLSDHRSYRCRNCRWQCIRPEDSEESLRDLCVDCTRLGRVSDIPDGPAFAALD